MRFFLFVLRPEHGRWIRINMKDLVELNEAIARCKKNGLEAFAEARS